MYDYAERIKKIASQDIVLGEDGYYVWWPDGTVIGGFNEASLRIIADLLEEKNKDWDEEVNKHFEGIENE